MVNIAHKINWNLITVISIVIGVIYHDSLLRSVYHLSFVFLN